jgi:hypothetical protein
VDAWNQNTRQATKGAHRTLHSRLKSNQGMMISTIIDAHEQDFDRSLRSSEQEHEYSSLMLADVSHLPSSSWTK